MKITLAVALFLRLSFGTPVYAQSLCSECLETAQEELNECLANAISEEDKNSCAEKQQAQMEDCENGECKIERDERNLGTEVLPQTK